MVSCLGRMRHASRNCSGRVCAIAVSPSPVSLARSSPRFGSLYFRAAGLMAGAPCTVACSVIMHSLTTTLAVWWLPERYGRRKQGGWHGELAAGAQLAVKAGWGVTIERPHIVNEGTQCKNRTIFCYLLLIICVCQYDNERTAPTAERAGGMIGGAYILSHSDHFLPFLAGFVYPALICLVLIAAALRIKRPAVVYRTILSHLRAPSDNDGGRTPAFPQAAHRTGRAIQHLPAIRLLGFY
jgi:hypothetical protein